MKHFQDGLLLLVVSLSLAIGIGAAAPADEPDDPIRVLILTGRNNHNWRATTPAIQQVLEAAGKFQVETTVPPQGLSAENLGRFDVIVSDWNSWGGGSKEAEAAWTPEVRKAYLDFVRGGGGHAAIHAGGSSFYEGWPEYRKVALIYWNLGTTGHGRQHEFPVRVEKSGHPLAAALTGFTIRDELWNRPGVVEGATVLASAHSDKEQEPSGTNRWEPSAVAATYGKGRCFATLLGHDANVMQNEGFQQLLLRGVQWAATGKVAVAEKSDAE